MELHTFRFQGLYLTCFNPVVKVCNTTTNLDTNFNHGSKMDIQPPKIFYGCHAERAANLSKIYLQELNNESTWLCSNYTRVAPKVMPPWKLQQIQ